MAFVCCRNFVVWLNGIDIVFEFLHEVCLLRLCVRDVVETLLFGLMAFWHHFWVSLWGLPYRALCKRCCRNFAVWLDGILASFLSFFMFRKNDTVLSFRNVWDRLSRWALSWVILLPRNLSRYPSSANTKLSGPFFNDTTNLSTSFIAVPMMMQSSMEVKIECQCWDMDQFQIVWSFFLQETLGAYSRALCLIFFHLVFVFVWMTRLP